MWRNVTATGGQCDTTRCTWVSTCRRFNAVANGKTSVRCAATWSAAGSWRARNAWTRSMPSNFGNHATAKRGSGGREWRSAAGMGLRARLEARELLAGVDVEEGLGLV